MIISMSLPTLKSFHNFVHAVSLMSKSFESHGRLIEKVLPRGESAAVSTLRMPWCLPGLVRPQPFGFELAGAYQPA